MVSASEETKIFYRSQGIPWIFHNLRRFIAGPATMLDPVGLFLPRDAIVEHVLQTFHRHPVYDLVLLRAHEQGMEEMARQADQIVAGTHPHQRALASLIEDGSYHARLPREIAAIRADPHIAARPIPPGLVEDAHMMLAMDQFKDIRGFTNYAARLKVSVGDAIRAWVYVAFDETLGGLVRVKLGPRKIDLAACDPEIAGSAPIGLTRESTLSAVRRGEGGVSGRPCEGDARASAASALAPDFRPRPRSRAQECPAARPPCGRTS